MSFRENPVINSPYGLPAQHYALDAEGQPTPVLEPGRRPSMQIVPVASARRGAKQGELGLGDAPQEVKVNRLVNEIRERVNLWRALPASQKKVTPETLRLLEHWSRPDRARRLFFCQREAAETLIYLTEVDPGRFRAQLEEANAEANPGLFRLASKMATGAGKTTVMGMIIAWHAVNRARRSRSKQFTDAFLVVCPGVTIRDRLRVLTAPDKTASAPAAAPLPSQAGAKPVPPCNGRLSRPRSRRQIRQTLQIAWDHSSLNSALIASDSE